MKWIKHDTDANNDAKLQNVLLDYGLEGYGLYWYCLELIAGKVDKDNITFELEHDARIIARNTGSTAQKVSEIMRYFVEIGLFEGTEGVITCLKIARRLDKSMTSNPQMREIIENLKSHDSVMIESENPMQDQIRLDQIRLDETKEDIVTFDKKENPAVLVLNHLNLVLGSKYKSTTKSHMQNINARLNEGHSVEDCKTVIDFKVNEWARKPDMAQYLRPQTLFGNKFQGYLTACLSHQSFGDQQYSDVTARNIQNTQGWADE